MNLQVQHIAKEFKGGTKVLTDVTFSVFQGEFVSVIGPSGAGKTTLFRILNGMTGSSQGQLLFDGQNFTSLHGRKKRELQKSIATIYQDFCLVENSTCLENVLAAALPDMGFWSGVLGMYGKSRKDEARELLDRVGLLEKEGEPVKNLSGGQKQRTAIARALMRHPSILLADEPGCLPGPGYRKTDSGASKKYSPDRGCHHSYEQPQSGVFQRVFRPTYWTEGWKSCVRRKCKRTDR